MEERVEESGSVICGAQEKEQETERTDRAFSRVIEEALEIENLAEQIEFQGWERDFSARLQNHFEKRLEKLNRLQIRLLNVVDKALVVLEDVSGNSRSQVQNLRQELLEMRPSEGQSSENG
jgi:hypothetical protein